MYLHDTLGRGLLDIATPLFTEIQNTLEPVFVEEDGNYVFEVEMPGFTKEDVKVNIESTGHLNLQGKAPKIYCRVWLHLFSDLLPLTESGCILSF